MVRSSLIVTLLALSASAMGFFVQLLLAKRYGVGVEVDAYLFAISFPTFIAGVISAVLSFNLIPRLVSFQSNVDSYHKFIGSLVIAITAISIILTIAMLSGMIFLINHLLPQGSGIFQYEDLEILISLTCLIGGVQILNGCFTAMLNAEKKYIQSALISLLPYVGMLIILFGLDKSIEIKFVAIGLLAGTLIAVFISLVLLRTSIFPLPWKNISWDLLWKLTRSSTYTALAMTCFSAYSIVDAYWGPRAGDGTLAILGYAQRLVIAFGNLAVAGPSAVLVPYFAEHLRNRNYRVFIKSIYKTFLFVGAVAASVAIFLGVFAIEIVMFLFGFSGIDSEQISNIASTITNMTPGMVALLLSVIGMRILLCFEAEHKTASVLGLCWTFGYFITSSFAYLYGAPGIALAYSAVWIAFFLAILTLIYKKTRTLIA
jgi:putative peptidoglycan lipid II flippase